MKQGYVQVYTGNGKGKTTAAFGLALRAVCAGKKVIILQFVKGMKYSELKATEFLPRLTIEQHGGGCFITHEPSPEDVALARVGLERLRDAASSGEYDVVIADELNIALHYNLFSVAEALDVIRARSAHTELIITGRYARPEIIDIADLVTEMTEVKHYYKQGIASREGIER